MRTSTFYKTIREVLKGRCWKKGKFMIKRLICWWRGHCICTVFDGTLLQQTHEYCYYCGKQWPGIYGFTFSGEREFRGNTK